LSSFRKIEEETGMDRESFDALTRRASLTTLSAAGLAVLARPGAASANKKGNKFKKCKEQVDVCNVRVLAECTGTQQQCAAQAACCDDLKRCKFDDFLTCLIAAEGTAAAAVLGRRT
jgi:hypothetical protein